MPHQLYLVVSLRDGGLVDANGIHPECAGARGQPQVSQGDMAIGGYVDDAVVAQYLVVANVGTPVI